MHRTIDRYRPAGATVYRPVFTINYINKQYSKQLLLYHTIYVKQVRLRKQLYVLCPIS